MLFNYPAFLWALTFLAVPVIIHLFNFRRFKKVMFTNVRFLKEITEETTSRSKLRHWLVLLCRLLAVSALVFAFAQPYIPVKNQVTVSGDQIISVYIDNSFSMEANGKKGALSDEAKNAAKEIVNAFKPSDRFQILTNDFEARHQRLVNREEALSQVDEIKTSASVRTLSEVVKRQEQAASGNAVYVNSYLISDMQKWQSDISQMNPDSNFHIFLIPLDAESSSNLYIDTCKLSSPYLLARKPVELTAVIRNFSDEPVEQLSIKLTINGIQKAVTNINLDAQAAAETQLSFTSSESGILKGEISIADYPVTFDDKWYFTIKMTDHISVLSLTGKGSNRYIRSVFDADPLFSLNVQSASQADYGSFSQFQTIVVSDLTELTTGLSNELEKYINAGGTLILFPDTTINSESYNYFFGKVTADLFDQPVEGEFQADRINYESDVMNGIFDLKQHQDKNIDFPAVRKYFRQTTHSRSSKEPIISLQNGNSFLSKYKYGKGQIYIFSQAAALAAGNLVNHALFAPVMYRMTMSSAVTNPVQYVIGHESGYVFKSPEQAGDLVCTLSNDELGVEVIPPVKVIAGIAELNLTGIIHTDGIYTLKNGDKLMDALAFNYDRRESELSYLGKDGLNSEILKSGLRNISIIPSTPAGYTRSVILQNHGIALWKWFLITALIFLAAEILLLRFFK